MPPMPDRGTAAVTVVGGDGVGGSGRSRRGEKPRRPKSATGARMTGRGGVDTGFVSVVYARSLVAAVVGEPPNRLVGALVDRGSNFEFATGTPISLGTRPTTIIT